MDVHLETDDRVVDQRQSVCRQISPATL